MAEVEEEEEEWWLTTVQLTHTHTHRARAVRGLRAKLSRCQRKEESGRREKIKTSSCCRKSVRSMKGDR